MCLKVTNITEWFIIYDQNMKTRDFAGMCTTTMIIKAASQAGPFF